MGEPGVVVQLPVKRPVRKRRKKPPQNIDGVKYFTENQIKLIRKTVRDKANLDHAKA